MILMSFSLPIRHDQGGHPNPGKSNEKSSCNQYVFTVDHPNFRWVLLFYRGIGH
jgi:hypothetical protein